MSYEEIDDEEIDDEKIIKFGGDVASQLLGYSVRFTYFRRSYYISPFVKVSLKKSVSYTSYDSYFKINFTDAIGPSYSFGQFNVSSKAEKLGIKLKGLVDEGEIFINYYSESKSIEIAVNVTKIRYLEYEVDFSVIIEFDLYKYKKYLEALQEQEEKEKQKKNEDAEKIKKAIGAGVAVAGAIVIAKIIKGGIGALLGGPIGAAIGFAS